MRRGRAAIFAECGLVRVLFSLRELNIVEKNNMPVLILTPLAVGAQTVREGFQTSTSKQNKAAMAPINSKIVVTNYHKLHYFNPNNFAGVVCDESGILKNYDGAIKSQVTEFMKKTKYRLLCTTTPAPNDLIELGIQ